MLKQQDDAMTPKIQFFSPTFYHVTLAQLYS
jgi:hypothetical protein